MPFSRSVGLLAVLLPLVFVPLSATAQNSPGDECIIQVRLHDGLTTASLAFDLLFNDSEWQNLTAAIDRDGDGFMDAEEVRMYENRSGGQLDSSAIPDTRRIILDAAFSRDAYSGEAGVGPYVATNATDLIDFIGPVEERSGRIVREHWTYFFEDPVAANTGGGSLAEHASNITLSWGPAAVEPARNVVVIETVVVTAPKDWWIEVDGVRKTTHTFASGDGYVITFVPDQPPRPEPWYLPGFSAMAAIAACALLLVSGRRL